MTEKLVLEGILFRIPRYETREINGKVELEWTELLIESTNEKSCRTTYRFPSIIQSDSLGKPIRIYEDDELGLIRIVTDSNREYKHFREQQNSTEDS